MPWPTKKLGEVIDFLKGKKMTVTEEQRLGYEPYIGIDTLRTREYKLYTSEKNGARCSKDDVLVVWDGAYAGTVGIEVSGFAGSTVAKVVIKEPELDSRFLRYFWEFKEAKIRSAAQGAAIPHLSKTFINNLGIPLPPLNIQKQIVERLDKIAEAQKLNDELIQKTDELFRSLLYNELDPVGKEWEVKKLGEIAETSSGGTPLKERAEFYEDGAIPWLRSGEVSQGLIYKSELFITERGLGHSSAKIFPIDTVLVAMYGATAGQIGLLKFEASTNQAICGILPNNKFIPEYLYYFLKTQTNRLIQISTGGAQPNISQQVIRNIKIPLPPLQTQKQIAAKLSAVQNYKAGLLGQKAKLKELFDSAIHKSMQN